MLYDMIGDVHGHATELERLLTKMGYRAVEGVWQHDQRTAVFLGDFIDRGPRQLDTLKIVRGMVESGSALAVMGNHEFNAIAFYLPDPTSPGEHLRPRSHKHRRQHEAFLREISEDSAEHADWINWFLTLPLWLDLGELRIVHACWHSPIIDKTQQHLGGGYLTKDFMPLACQSGGSSSRPFGADGRAPKGGSELFHCLEILLKGIEVELPTGSTFSDSDGFERDCARVRWWLDHPTSYRDGALAVKEKDVLPDEWLPSAVLKGHDGGSPIFVGHYWLTGRPAPLTHKIACVDYSVARNGTMAAYQWDGEPELQASKFVIA